MNDLFLKASVLDMIEWLNVKIKQEKFDEVYEACNVMIAHRSAELEQAQMLPQFVNSLHTSKAKISLPGREYVDWLKWFHTHLNPELYFEIGVETGKTLRFAKQFAIGVDPALKISEGFANWVKLFQTESDTFFEQNDVDALLQGKKINFAFIDGLHTFDQALKDFENVERYSDANTVAVFHDIYPTTPITAARDRVTNFWLGDTWKVVPLLKEARPDLNIFTIPTYPSGLTVVTRLKSEKYGELDRAGLVEKWMAETHHYSDAELIDLLNVIEANSEEAVIQHLAK